MSENNTSKDPKETPEIGYKPLLSDDDGTAQPIRRKKDPMAKVRKEIEEQQRQQREKAELLKFRQGLTDEEEELPEPEVRTYEKPKGWKAVENFFYHYKWILGISIFAVAVVTILTVQILTQERYDLYVLLIANSSSSGFLAKSGDIETALERYCPDFDGNGYVHVAVNYIDLINKDVMSEYNDAQRSKFSAELYTGDSQLYFTDTGIISLINDVSGRKGNIVSSTEEAVPESTAEETLIIEFFTDFSEEYPDAVLYQGCGLQLNTTGFIDEARWQSCPDTVGIYVRDEFENMTGNDKESIEQRRRAKIVYDNIVNGNVVNSDWEGR